MTDVTKISFDIIRAYLSNTEYKKKLTEEEISDAFALLQKHDLGHIAGIVLQKTYDNEMLVQTQYMAALRYEKLNYEFERVCNVFEKHEIPYIPLKGAVIRKWYPKPWHRTSVDIDILVSESYLDKASDALIKDLEYTRNALIGDHDLQMYSPNGVHLELHFDLCREGIRTAEAIETATPVTGHQYSMLPEMFVLYHIAHMAKHFKRGGCGVKPLLDIVFINRNLKYNKEQLDKLLEKNGLKKFADSMFELSEILFGDKETNDFYDRLSKYIIDAGVYGTLQNGVLVGHAMKNGRTRYILGRIFLKRDSLKYIYPKIEKYPWLLPVYEVARGINLMKPDRIYRAKKEFEINRKVSRAQQNFVADLLSSLELN